MQIPWPIASEPPVLASDEAHVWVVSLKDEGFGSPDRLKTLSADERERAAAFRFDDPQRRFVIARAALRILLGKYLGERPDAIEFGFGPSGKPRLAGKHVGAGLRFNLSHSGDTALVAFTRDCEIGVDVEQLRDVGHLEQIARRYFHPEEVAEVLAVSEEARREAFFRCWTRKEAVLKALGTGVTGRLDAFRVPINSQTAGWIDFPADDVGNVSRCWLQPLAVGSGGYLAAAAVVAGERRIRGFAFST